MAQCVGTEWTNVAQDRLGWRAKMDAMIQVEKTTGDGGSKCQYHRMTIDLINSMFASTTQHNVIGPHMCSWHLRMNTWNTQNTQKTAAKQAIRMRTKTSTHGTRCWRCSRCQAPAQRYNRACRIGRCAGWLCRAIFRWTFCTCPWNGKQGSDCRDAQIELCGLAYTCLKAWEAGERLL